ncbi:MAG TPA: 8-oxo-dGTP diphosphatase MutT [Steroidobacteraceae bacterium]|nr:8-oxo-dGTP diphosphatase MutT [Steroidobacteraceae bacterium]
MSGSVQDRADPANRGLAGGARRRRPIHVVAGVLTDEADRVLLAQRPEGKHLAGGWEFPGGKLEPGEKRYAALERELKEELGIEVVAARPLIRARHQYPTREILLDVWVVSEYRGEPAGLDGQALRWCARADLPAAKLLPADRPIVTALQLPARLMQAAGPHYVLGESAASPDSGDQRGAVGSAHSAVGRAHSTVGSAHSTVGRALLHGIYCDGHRQALAAAAPGADFLVLREPLDEAELTALCDAVQVPVYARGISLQAAWNAGCIGVNELS